MRGIHTTIRLFVERLAPGFVGERQVLRGFLTRLLEADPTVWGEVKGISPELTAIEPDTQWSNIAGMRDFLAHHYFAMSPERITCPRDRRVSARVGHTRPSTPQT
ncbi:MAG: HepT-like ribonuclease domain-containing protein [Nocardioidaceae bacterium]